jgi:hypothetical protein
MVGPKVVTAAEGGKLWQLFHIILPFFKDNIRHFGPNKQHERRRAESRATNTTNYRVSTFFTWNLSSSSSSTPIVMMIRFASLKRDGNF